MRRKSDQLKNYFKIYSKYYQYYKKYIELFKNEPKREEKSLWKFCDTDDIIDQIDDFYNLFLKYRTKTNKNYIVSINYLKNMMKICNIEADPSVMSITKLYENGNIQVTITVSNCKYEGIVTPENYIIKVTEEPLIDDKDFEDILDLFTKRFS